MKGSWRRKASYLTPAWYTSGKTEHWEIRLPCLPVFELTSTETTSYIGIGAKRVLIYTTAMSVAKVGYIKTVSRPSGTCIRLAPSPVSEGTKRSRPRARWGRGIMWHKVFSLRGHTRGGDTHWYFSVKGLGYSLGAQPLFIGISVLTLTLFQTKAA